MKKIITLILTLAICTTVFGQKEKKEYHYLGVKVFVSNNLSFPTAKNNYVLIKSPYGDLLKENKDIFTYTPGGGASIVYNFDFKNEVAGIIFGLSIDNYGFTNKFKDQTPKSDFSVVNQYRALQLGVPLMLKFGIKSVYKNQAYMTAGLQFNKYFMYYNYQRASWNESTTVKKMPKEQVNGSSLAGVLGLNYNMFFVNLQYNLKNFINKEYTTSTSEGIVKPYKHLSSFNSLYIQLGVNIPMTRWLTSRNWTAEKIRRKFSSPK